MQNIERELRDFINESFLFGQGTEDIGGDDSFMERGIIDSTGVLELVNFIEQRFGVKLADEELVPDNLDSLNRIMSFVERKLVCAAVAG